MSNGRVITRPGQLDELRHGHRTALRSSAGDSPGDARLDPAARTAKRAGSRSPSTPELDDLQRTGRPISDCASLGATRQLMPRAGVERTRSRTAEPSSHGCSARMHERSTGTNRVPGPDEDQLRRWEFSPLSLPRQGDHPHGPLSVNGRTASSAAPGDKGNIADMSVIGYDPPEFEFIRQHVTCLRVREHFADIALGPVKRYEPPQLAVLKFVLPDAPEGGVAPTFNHDIHGKSLSSCLFELELPECPQRGQIDG
jgi:hypothetical protein